MRGVLRGPTGPEDDRAFWQRPGWVISAGFMSAVLVFGLMAFLMSGGQARGTMAPASGPAATGGEPPPARCAAADRDQRLPTAPPPHIEWITVAGVRVPASPVAGPLLRRDGVWSCYARTPLGAVMAAHGITAHLSTASWRSVAEQQIVPGVGRDRFVFQRGFVDVPDTPITGGYAGFSVSDYSRTSAVVGMLIRREESYFSTYIWMKWVAGDWRIEPDPSGSLYSPLESRMTADGFTLWES
ncbi:hypothetical protein V2S66_21265 [Streptomyces sp. V4-01]|uniref:DUF8175 domain-containing protein n=1 Tax=Actinacidiphila polyblastidii TaxID=3110430 RepID=A0ABU7PFE0_9ACTN|nr:hypothetical protein [Streptomyces sp. V4-01]